MKYYKITNEKERHHDLQYHDGLNIDPVPFNPEGSCVPGGIYFTSKDILAFLHYGPWIREVTIPADAQWVKDPGNGPEKFRADKVILGPRRRIDAKVIKELITEGADVHADNDDALIWASRNGHLEIVKVLLEAGVNVHADNDRALRWASHNGHLEVVKVLLEHGADVHASDDEALRVASMNGHLEVVKLLKEYMKDQ